MEDARPERVWIVENGLEVEDTHRGAIMRTGLPGSGRLHQMAWRAGWLAGKAVRGARDLPGKTGEVRKRMRRMSTEASGRARRAKEQVLNADPRDKARDFVEENPLQAVAALAVLSFCVGFALRLLRSRHGV